MRVLSRVALVAILLIAAAPAHATPLGGNGEVTAVSLLHTSGRADLVVSVSGQVTVKEMTLADPLRLVLDLHGTTLAPGAETMYDGVNRAGIRNVRIRQYQADVVRIVLDLDQMPTYRVEHEMGAVRLSFGADLAFSPWSTMLGLPAVMPTAEPVPAVSAPEVTPVEPARMVQPRPEPRLTVTWENASIEEVVRGFSEISGRNIIVGKGITATITARIVDTPWHQAFQAILGAHGLSVQEMPGGILRVDSPAALAELDSLEPLMTRVVRINYKRASAMTGAVEAITGSGRGKVYADTSSNSLIITDTRTRVAEIENFVRGLDIRTASVSIQAKLIFVDRTDLEALGLRYDLGNRDQFFNRIISRPNPLQGNQPYQPGINVVNLGGNSVAALGNAEALITNPALDLIFSTAIGGFSLTSFLSALERVELSDVQAEPLIQTLDNQRAEILVGEEIPVRIIDYSGSQTTAGQAPRATVQFKETGIRLGVTPHVTSNRQILMELETERSALQVLAAADLGYTINQQKASNQLLVADGETAVIGGLTVTTVTRIRSGIPLLSSLPFIGPLFSFNQVIENRKDLIIMVTPRIIDDGDDLIP
ncbi:MAG: AMIN domain-containing protein [Gemmatimonadales bacterium]